MRRWKLDAGSWITGIEALIGASAGRMRSGTLHLWSARTTR
jgi:hypothetical protein